MTFFELRVIQWNDKFVIHEKDSGMPDIMIPQEIQIESTFFKSANHAINAYEKAKENLWLIVDSMDLRKELFHPLGLEGGESLSPGLSSGLEFESGSRTFWLDSGDHHFGVILYECEFEPEIEE